MSFMHEKLMETEFSHAYYTDLRCEDFHIFPSEETARLLHNHRLLFRNTDTGFLILQTRYSDGSGAVIPLATGTRFTFFMRLRNKHFETFTDFAVSKTGRRDIYYFDNSDADELKLIRTAMLQSPVFKYVFQKQGTVQLTVKSPAGDKLIDGETLTVSASAPDTPIDLSIYGPGLYLFEEDADGETTESKYIYIDGSTLSREVFGIIEIVKDNDTFKAYDFAFEAKSTLWVYYLKLKRGYTTLCADFEANMGTKYFFIIEDQEDDPSAKLDFTQVDQTLLEDKIGVEYIGKNLKGRILDPPQPLDSDADYENKCQEGKVLAFMSGKIDGEDFIQQPVTFQEKARKKIQLKFKNGDQEILVLDSLENPSVTGALQEVYINV